ncbi:glycosyltransferase involved in cell wall biosynthesis [Rhizomicrobium palustre]|uniref:Glycosyltransferase involved in cell wall biosynthesis n=1 Tax=Rhizomicrobium palustre TaxID=189966 RepID=A0A846N272_9PROT|nr:glycosyltransferase [Rhizomicrobium palustre]NIK89836.1 glycosyltransferase involved in cell wall biosynthesis [Rhizomicrobium palustre]
MSERIGMIEVDFTLALHNRTGKYFIGRDIINANLGRIYQLRYWRLKGTPAEGPPLGLKARIIGRLAVDEMRLRAMNPELRALRLRPARVVLHLDPLTVLTHRLTRHDAVLCHDVGPLTHPELFEPDVVAGYGEAYREIAEAGAHMVFVSKASERAFHKAVPGRYSSSQVVYPSLRNEVGSGASTPLDIEKPFLLTVGYVGARKNQLTAIRAFQQSGLAEKGFRYVICGGREAGYEPVAQAAGQTPGVKLLSYVGDGELNWLYANAEGFVLPSLLEGFGVPVAEANRAGLVPIVSRDSVLEEVAGEGALAVNPLDCAEIAAAMQHLAFMPESERQSRRAMLAQSVARFSEEAFLAGWDRVTAEAAERSLVFAERQAA